MFALIDERPFFLGVRAPENEGNSLAMMAHRVNQPIGEILPADLRMGAGFSRLHCQNGV